jgi:hypothetical protein
MATLFTDNFDSYTDGDLIAQGSWDGSTTFDVQTSVTNRRVNFSIYQKDSK